MVSIAADKANRSHHEHQNDGEHHRVFGDILALFVGPELSRKLDKGKGSGCDSFRLWLHLIPTFANAGHHSASPSSGGDRPSI